MEYDNKTEYRHSIAIGCAFWVCIIGIIASLGWYATYIVSP